MSIYRNSSLSAALALLSAFAPAQQTAVQDSLPDSTLMMAAFGGLERCTGAVRDHATANLVQELLKLVPPELLESQLGSKLDEAADGIREGLAQGSLSPTVIRNVLQRPMAIGMGRLTIRGMGPSIALVIEEGNAGADLDKLVDDVIASRALPARLGKATAAGVECRTIEGEDMPTIYIAREQGRWILTNSEGYLAEILATCRGKQASLLQGTSLGASRARLQGTPLVEVFANSKPLLPMLAPMMPYEAAAIGEAIGIESVGGLYLAAAQAGDGTVETIDVQLPGSSGGILKAALAGAADLEAAAFCSKDTIAFGALRLDIPAVTAAFDRLLLQLPREAAREMRRDVARDFGRGFREAGLSTEEVEKLLSAIDGTLSFGVTIGTGSLPIPDVVLLGKVRDEATVTQWLDRLRTAVGNETGIAWKTRQHGDRTLHYCTVQPGGDGPAISLSPTFVLADGYLVAGSQTRSVIEALQQRESRDDSLLGEADFQAAMKQDRGAMGFLHLRPGRAIETNWRLIETWVLPQIDAQEDQLGFSSKDLPEPEDFSKGLGTMTLSATCDEAGLRLRMRGNVGLGGMAASFFAVVDEVLQRASAKVY